MNLDIAPPASFDNVLLSLLADLIDDCCSFLGGILLRQRSGFSSKTAESMRMDEIPD
jgi:hypothetical protein